MLRNLARTALLAGATSLALMVGTPAEATGKHLTILASVPDLAFPFFVYMMGQIKDEAYRLGDITVVESDGERSSPKQIADVEAAITKGVDGIVINPNDFDALAPALLGASRYHQGQCRRGRAHWRSEIGQWSESAQLPAARTRYKIVVLVLMSLRSIRSWARPQIMRNTVAQT
jgi:Periplasmic binding protein domain